MPEGFDDDWSATVCSLLDQLFLSASAGFSRTAPEQPRNGVVEDMLWEADPLRFAERYPDSRIIDSYGGQWPPPCIDYWVYIDAGARRALISTEGWSAERQSLDLTGRGNDDAQRIGEVLGAILSVRT